MSRTAHCDQFSILNRTQKSSIFSFCFPLLFFILGSQVLCKKFLLNLKLMAPRVPITGDHRPQVLGLSLSFSSWGAPQQCRNYLRRSSTMPSSHAYTFSKKRLYYNFLQDILFYCPSPFSVPKRKNRYSYLELMVHIILHLFLFSPKNAEGQLNKTPGMINYFLIIMVSLQKHPVGKEIRFGDPFTSNIFLFQQVATVCTLCRNFLVAHANAFGLTRQGLHQSQYTFVTKKLSLTAAQCKISETLWTN